MIDLVFSAKTTGSEEWKAVISAVSTLVEEATFEATVELILTGQTLPLKNMSVTLI